MGMTFLSACLTRTLQLGLDTWQARDSTSCSTYALFPAPPLLLSNMHFCAAPADTLYDFSAENEMVWRKEGDTWEEEAADEEGEEDPTLTASDIQKAMAPHAA